MTFSVSVLHRYCVKWNLVELTHLLLKNVVYCYKQQSKLITRSIPGRIVNIGNNSLATAKHILHINAVSKITKHAIVWTGSNPNPKPPPASATAVLSCPAPSAECKAIHSIILPKWKMPSPPKKKRIQNGQNFFREKKWPMSSRKVSRWRLGLLLFCSSSSSIHVLMSSCPAMAFIISYGSATAHVARVAIINGSQSLEKTSARDRAAVATRWWQLDKERGALTRVQHWRRCSTCARHPGFRQVAGVGWGRCHGGGQSGPTWQSKWGPPVPPPLCA